MVSYCVELMSVYSITVGKFVLSSMFNHVRHKNDTELSKEFWKIKKRGGIAEITWKISKPCLLCLNGKYKTATYKGDNLLKKRTEIIKTRNVNAFLCLFNAQFINTHTNAVSHIES